MADNNPLTLNENINFMIISVSADHGELGSRKIRKMITEPTMTRNNKVDNKRSPCLT